jgi:predicted phage-related endonuclease
MIATPDRIVQNGAQRWLLEIKTVGMGSDAFWGWVPEGHFGDVTGVPLHVQAQCQWQMAVTGMTRCDVITGFLVSRDIRMYTVLREDEAIAGLKEAAGDLWHNHILTKIPPDPEEEGYSAEVLQRMFPVVRGEVLPMIPEVETLARDYNEANGRMSKAEADKERLRSQLCMLIGKHAGYQGNGVKVIWKPNKAGKPDYKGLALHLGATQDQIDAFRNDPPRVLRCNVKD